MRGHSHIRARHMPPCHPRAHRIARGGAPTFSINRARASHDAATGSIRACAQRAAQRAAQGHGVISGSTWYPRGQHGVHGQHSAPQGTYRVNPRCIRVQSECSLGYQPDMRRVVALGSTVADHHSRHCTAVGLSRAPVYAWHGRALCASVGAVGVRWGRIGYNVPP